MLPRFQTEKSAASLLPNVLQTVEGQPTFFQRYGYFKFVTIALEKAEFGLIEILSKGLDICVFWEPRVSHFLPLEK